MTCKECPVVECTALGRQVELSARIIGGIHFLVRKGNSKLASGEVIRSWNQPDQSDRVSGIWIQASAFFFYTWQIYQTTCIHDYTNQGNYQTVQINFFLTSSRLRSIVA